MSVLFCPCSFGGMDLWYVYPYLLYIYNIQGLQGHQVQISSSPRLLIDCHGNFQAIPNAFLKKIATDPITSHLQVEINQGIGEFGHASVSTAWHHKCQGMQALRAELLSEFEAPPRWPNVHPSRWKWWSYVLICHNCSSCFIMCPLKVI